MNSVVGWFFNGFLISALCFLIIIVIGDYFESNKKQKDELINEIIKLKDLNRTLTIKNENEQSETRSLRVLLAQDSREIEKIKKEKDSIANELRLIKMDCYTNMSSLWRLTRDDQKKDNIIKQKDIEITKLKCELNLCKGNVGFSE